MMPVDVVELAERIRQSASLKPEIQLGPSERFLLDEGLDLLATYRLIVDQTVRSLVAEFVQAVAALQDPESLEQPVVLRLVRGNE